MREGPASSPGRGATGHQTDGPSGPRACPPAVAAAHGPSQPLGSEQHPTPARHPWARMMATAHSNAKHSLAELGPHDQVGPRSRRSRSQGSLPKVTGLVLTSLSSLGLHSCLPQGSETPGLNIYNWRPRLVPAKHQPPDSVGDWAAAGRAASGKHPREAPRPAPGSCLSRAGLPPQSPSLGGIWSTSTRRRRPLGPQLRLSSDGRPRRTALAPPTAHNVAG